MKSYLILKGSGDHQFELNHGVFFSFQTEMLGGIHCCFLVNLTELKADRLQKSLAEIKNMFAQGTWGTSIVKIVGSTTALAQAKELLKSNDFFSRIKWVPREGALEIVFRPQDHRVQVASKQITAKQIVAKQESRNQEPKKPYSVLVVDDSKTIRTLLKKIISESQDLKLVADTGKPLEVIELIEKYKPDVITLDIHMPDMDGVTLLKKYIKNYPVPTVMISSISIAEGPAVLDALESGAVDYIKKPEANELEEVSHLIREKLLSAAVSQVKRQVAHSSPTTKPIEGLDSNAIIAIGSSTGGTEALKTIFLGLPAQIPPILVVQHIPPVFSKAFADRLNSLCPFHVKEAENGELISLNTIYIAPGGQQMSIKKQGSQMRVVIDDSPPVNRHKPSVDVLFDSLIDNNIRHNPIGIILTGMGSDGARGLLKLKENKWITIAQDKESCVVFGMPQQAIQLGAASHVLPLQSIAKKISQLIPGKKALAG